MTLQTERARALRSAGEFIKELIDANELSEDRTRKALVIMRHYPTSAEIDLQFGNENVAAGSISSPDPSPGASSTTLSQHDARFIEDLQEVGLAPMLSPTRYISLLGIDAKTLARDARVTVSALNKTPGAASIQRHLRNNLRVIKAAYDVSGGDLAKSLHWFQTEPLPMFGQRTAEQMVSAGQVDDVIRLIDFYRAGAAG
ncbi:hypothetical protein D9M73_42150 [compost metagenome]